MSRIGLLDDGVVYPTSDGQPMAETPVHGDCMMYVTSALRWWFTKRGRDDVYVRHEQLPVLRAGQPPGGGGAGRVRGAGCAGKATRHVHAVERAEGAGLRAGGDVEEHAGRRRAAQARCVCLARGAGVLPLRPAGGVPHAAASGLSAARGNVPCGAGGDGAVEPRGGGGERGAGARASRRARGAAGAAARPCDRGGAPHARGKRADPGRKPNKPAGRRLSHAGLPRRGSWNSKPVCGR